MTALPTLTSRFYFLSSFHIIYERGPQMWALLNMILSTFFTSFWDWFVDLKPVTCPLQSGIPESNLSTGSRREARWIPPGTHLTPRCHPLEAQMTDEVENYFIERWNFSSPKAAHKFRAAGFSRVTCLYFPEAQDDRILHACKLLSILFLIDGWYYAVLWVSVLSLRRSARRHVFRKGKSLQ